VLLLSRARGLVVWSTVKPLGSGAKDKRPREFFENTGITLMRRQRQCEIATRLS